MAAGDVTQKQLEILTPFFRVLIDNIHDKWETLDLKDGETAKMLKFQLIAVKNLEQAMQLRVTHGKQAAKRIEGAK